MNNCKKPNIEIPHLQEIKKIRKYEQDVLKETHVPVCDISHWNPGTKYQKTILSQLKIDNLSDILNYHYSYECNNNIKENVKSHLLYPVPNKLNCVFIHNATAAICCIADYLKKHKYNRICILEPNYFSLYSCLLSFGLKVYRESIILENGNEIKLPFDKIIRQKYDVLWITSPIFSTGIYYTQKQIDDINSIVKKGVLLIIDESATSPDKILSSRLQLRDNIISIFSPHKYLAINSIKFAVIICNYAISNYIEDWIDVFVGALPASTDIAIKHFLSSNFVVCLNIHNKYIEQNIKIVQELCQQFPNNYYQGEIANYITICNKTLAYTESLEKLNIMSIIKQTHVSFIPGYVNHFSKEWGFCYRINLLLNSDVLKKCLGKLFNYFLS